MDQLIDGTLTLKTSPIYKMIVNCLSVFDHFGVLALKGGRGGGKGGREQFQFFNIFIKT